MVHSFTPEEQVKICDNCHFLEKEIVAVFAYQSIKMLNFLLIGYPTGANEMGDNSQKKNKL